MPPPGVGGEIVGGSGGKRKREYGERANEEAGDMMDPTGWGVQIQAPTGWGVTVPSACAFAAPGYSRLAIPTQGMRIQAPKGEVSLPD